MRKRFAAHYVFYGQALYMYYIEIQDGLFAGVFPLDEELAGTAFFDGILLPLPVSMEREAVDAVLSYLRREHLPLTWENFSSGFPGNELIGENDPVRLFLLDSHRYSSSELSTNN